MWKNKSKHIGLSILLFVLLFCGCSSVNRYTSIPKTTYAPENKYQKENYSTPEEKQQEDSQKATNSKMQEGLDLYRSFEYRKAADKLKESVQTESLSKDNGIKAHVYTGASYYLLNEKDKAKNEFNEALKLDNNSTIDSNVFQPKIIKLFKDCQKEMKNK